MSSQLDLFLMFNPSPTEMRAEALQTKTTVWRDGLTVSPEGVFFLSGRRVTLNEAVMYFGTRRKRRESGELARLGFE